MRGVFAGAYRGTLNDTTMDRADALSPTAARSLEAPMAGVDKSAVLNYLTDSMRVLHAEDQALQLALRRVQSTRTVGPDEFEAMCDAQRASLRIPANALLMLMAYLDDAPPPPQPEHPSAPPFVGRGARGVRGALRKLLRRP